MAAHVLTGLNQLKEMQFTKDALLGALNLSCWTEDLDFSDYCKLRELVDVPDADYTPEHVSLWASDRTLYNRYYTRWLSYGSPETREEWRAAWLKENKR